MNSHVLSSLHQLYIAIFVIILVPPSLYAVDDKYKTCSSVLFSCGNTITNVGYPFWGELRPPYCGISDLQLQCLSNELGDVTTLKIGGNSEAPYRVLNKKTSDFNITLDLLGLENISCSYNMTALSNEFTFSPSVETATFLYNCLLYIGFNPHDSISCYLDTTVKRVNYLYNTSVVKDYASCSSTQVPVSRSHWNLYNSGHGSLSEVLKQGFEVNYEYSSDCIKCHKSGGTCGSSLGSDFDCHYKKSGKLKLILGLSISGGLLILLGLNIGLCYCLKLKFRSPGLLSRIISTNPGISDLETGGSFNGISVFSYAELQDATNNFDNNRELGDGGFGIVYYGKLRDGTEVAVKKLYEKNYKQVEQFMNEVQILTHLHHPNLVILYGCTSRHSRELLLVYEYISNGTVADHLHGDTSASKSLTWDIRMKIAIETASALSYLHSSDIIHRDVKTNNILLTNNFSVKVADFGLSRLFPLDVTHVSTTPQGTPGYLDPEYHKCYQVTDKSDVYSFGVVLVELISSLPAVDIRRHDDEINLSDYALNRIQRGILDELVDQRLGYSDDFKVKRMVNLVAEVAFRCLQQGKDVRPCMSEVFETLVQIEGLDYEALEEGEMDEKRNSVSHGDNIVEPSNSPSSVIDNWAIKSTSSNPSG